MDKETWKWFLDSAPDDFLIQLLMKTKLKIDGFSSIKVQNLHVIKPKIFASITKKIVTINKLVSLWIKEEGWDEYRGKQLAELKQVIETDRSLYGSVILALLTGNDIQRAEAHMIHESFVGPLEVTENVDLHEEEGTSDGTDFKKLQREINSLKKKLDAAQSQLNQMAESNRKLTKRIEDLKKQHQKERKDWESERVSLIEKLGGFEESAPTQTIHIKRPPRVGFICSSSVLVDQLSGTLWYNLQRIDPTGIMQADSYDILRDFEEIWIMNRDLNLRQRRQVKKKFNDEVPVCFFESQDQVTNYIEQHKGE